METKLTNKSKGRIITGIIIIIITLLSFLWIETLIFNKIFDEENSKNTLNSYHIVRVMEVDAEGYDMSKVPLDINGDFAEPFEFYLQVADGVLLPLDKTSRSFVYKCGNDTLESKWVDVAKLDVTSSSDGSICTVKARVLIFKHQFGFTKECKVSVRDF